MSVLYAKTHDRVNCSIALVYSAISARSLRGQLLVLGLRITVFDTVDANENLYDCPKADPHSYEYRRSSWKSH